jgi:hypothetical protein
MGLRFLRGFGFRGGASLAGRGMMTPPLPRGLQLARCNALCEVSRSVVSLMQGTRDGWFTGWWMTREVVDMRGVGDVVGKSEKFRSVSWSSGVEFSVMREAATIFWGLELSEAANSLAEP